MIWLNFLYVQVYLKAAQILKNMKRYLKEQIFVSSFKKSKTKVKIFF